MTVSMADAEVLRRLVCAECGNDTFTLAAVVTSSDAVRIKGTTCAVCGDETPFSPPDPEDRH